MMMHGLPWFWNLSRFELRLILALIFISACFISEKSSIDFWDLVGKPIANGKYSLKQRLLQLFLFLNLLLFTLFAIT